MNVLHLLDRLRCTTLSCDVIDHSCPISNQHSLVSVYMGLMILGEHASHVVLYVSHFDWQIYIQPCFCLNGSNEIVTACFSCGPVFFIFWLTNLHFSYRNVFLNTIFSLNIFNCVQLDTFGDLENMFYKIKAAKIKKLSEKVL